MCIKFSPSPRLKERLGHVAVGGLLALAFWATYGCGNGRSPQERRQQPEVGQVMQHPTATTPVVTTVETPEEPAPSASREVTFEEAEAAYRDHRYGDAISLFAAYVDQKPNSAWGHYMLGLSAWKQGDYETAEEGFRHALERDPEHLKSMINLSRVYLDTERPEEAIERAQEALLIDGESSDAFRLLGRARHELGLVEEAIDAYWEAIVLDDRDVWSMNNLGFVLIQEERFEEALPPLARATELRRGVPVFQNNLGIALERTGHFTAAAEAYGAALRADSSYEKASVNLVRVQELEENPQRGPVDLAALALEFMDEIERFRQPVTAEVPEQLIVPDSSTIPDDEEQEPVDPPQW